jgi:predicted nucleic acid-binding protein
MIRAVLDTNVIVSGVLKEDSVPGRLLKDFLERNHNF